MYSCYFLQPDFENFEPKKKKLGKRRKNKNARIGVPGRRDFRPDDYSQQHLRLQKHYRLPQPHHLATVGPHFHQLPTSPSFSHSTSRTPKQFFDSEPNFSTTPTPHQESQPFRSSPFATTPTPDILRLVPSTTPIPNHEPVIFQTQPPQILRTTPTSSSFEFQFSSTTQRPFVPSPAFGSPHVVGNHATSQHFSEDFVPGFHSHSTARPPVHLNFHDDFLGVAKPPPQAIVRYTMKNKNVEL